MKRLFVLHFWLTLSLTLFFVLTLSFGARAQEYKWKLGHALAPSHPIHLAAVEFSKAVEKETNGKVKIEVYPSNTLGSERDAAQQLQFGGLEMGFMTLASFHSIEPKLEIEELPYAWPTRQHAYAALDGELGSKLKSLIAPKGIYILAFGEQGYRHFTNNVRPIRKIDDAKGLKIRTFEARMRLDTFKLLGIMPTPMSFHEVYVALQQGTIDGQENPLTTIYHAKLYEVQKYLTLSGHIWNSDNFNVSKMHWDKLPKDIQDVIQRNASKYAIYERMLTQQSENEIIAELKKKGMQVNEVDTRPFRVATQPIYDQYAKYFGEDLMDLVAKYSK